jgi:hypothetical protein
VFHVKDVGEKMGYPRDFEDVWKFLQSCGPEGREWWEKSVKKTAYQRWKNLKQDEKAAAIRGIPLFIAHVKEERRRFPERQFCMFNVYLNQARWENLIEIEEQRFAAMENAKGVAARRAREAPQQATLTLVVPMEERRAKLAAANSSLIKQNRELIVPVIEECVNLAKSRTDLIARRRWSELRQKLPYLPEDWKEVRFG